MELIIIAALSENNVIGLDNKLPWAIPEDLAYFKQVTRGYPIIMGRKTYESIGRPLPKRLNVILTRQQDYQPKKTITHSSLEDALQDEKVQTYDKAFIIGGQSVYEQALPLADILKLTRVHKTVEGDSYFPKIDYTQWMETSRIIGEKCSYLTYRRKK